MNEQNIAIGLLSLLIEHGDSWKLWVGLAVCVLVFMIGKAKKFRFLIELSTDERKKNE